MWRFKTIALPPLTPRPKLPLGCHNSTLKRIGNDAIEETDKRDGKVVGVFKMRVSPDGRWINVEYKNKERGTTTYRMEKQSQATNPVSATTSADGARLATVSAANC